MDTSELRAPPNAMPRFTRYQVHPENPQARLLMHGAAMLREGAIAAIPTATGYHLACRFDDKAAGDKLRWLLDADERDPAVLLCRSLTRASGYVRIDNQTFRDIRAHEAGTEAFPLPCTRNVPRRIAPKGEALLYFAGHIATQALLEFVDEPLLLAPAEAEMDAVDLLPRAWQDAMHLAIDVGPLHVTASFPSRRGVEAGERLPAAEAALGAAVA